MLLEAFISPDRGFSSQGKDPPITSLKFYQGRVRQAL